MQVNAYSMTVPVFVRTLSNLAGILDKAAAFCEQRKVKESVLMEARLFPDMYPLALQVRIACDVARGATARLAGEEPPKFEDNEATLADLKTRIARTTEYVQRFGAAQLSDAEGRRIVRTVGGREIAFDGYTYLAQFALPNFFFHVTTAYDILRSNGVELGKRDYLGSF